MKTMTPSFWVFSSALLLTLLAGCGKKETGVHASVTETTAPVAQQVQPAAKPALLTPDTGLAESQAALKARDYDKAAATLVAMQATRLNEHQAAAAAAQMRQLQSSLASAVASGDPRAIAAANRLREASKVH